MRFEKGIDHSLEYGKEKEALQKSLSYMSQWIKRTGLISEPVVKVYDLVIFCFEELGISAEALR